MANEIPAAAEELPIEAGDIVYNDDGTAVGIVRRVSSGTVTVDTADEVTSADGSLNNDETVPGDEFGEGFLMWRCIDCGEMGDLDDGRPDGCPNCGAPQNALAKARED